jgi:hypothetical protein
MVTSKYPLTYCNFNIQTYEYIEKITNPLGNFLVNLVCIENDLTKQNKDKNLNFIVELVKYPDAYIKQSNILNLTVKKVLSSILFILLLITNVFIVSFRQSIS